MKKSYINKLSEYKYQINQFDKTNFFKSIFELLDNNNATIIKNEITSDINIEFYATSVKPLLYYQEHNLIDYHLIILIIYSLYKQQTILEKYGIGFYGIDINDIIIIDSKIVICINTTFIKDINNEHFIFNSPFNRELKHFFSPEIININIIPSIISNKCFYYSLGSLSVYCLFGIKINPENHDIDYKIILKPIAQTKLYWMILKSLSFDCNTRTLIFI